VPTWTAAGAHSSVQGPAPLYGERHRPHALDEELPQLPVLGAVSEQGTPLLVQRIARANPKVLRHVPSSSACPALCECQQFFFASTGLLSCVSGHMREVQASFSGASCGQVQARALRAGAGGQELGQE
jgi:hypothetical protein